jgi:hypothetical protein
LLKRGQGERESYFERAGLFAKKVPLRRGAGVYRRGKLEEVLIIGWKQDILVSTLRSLLA